MPYANATNFHFDGGVGSIDMRKRRTGKGATAPARQMEFDFSRSTIIQSSPSSLSKRVAKRSREIRFWPGFFGKRAPAPYNEETPLNTKRAAHYLRRSSRWMEAVRHEPNSPPWRKVGGVFEYYESQLDWWKEQIADM